MKRRTKISLIVATALVVVGCIFLLGGMAMLNWDFSSWSTFSYVTNQHTPEGTFTKISIEADTADIVFLPSENGSCSVECYEMEKAQHSVAVQNGTLQIRVEDNRKWYEYIGINFGNPKITVYLPQAQYKELAIRASTGDVTIHHPYTFGNVQITLSTGDIQISNLSAHTAYLSVSTGKITVSDSECSDLLNVFVTTGKSHLKNITCRIFSSGGGTGDVSLENVIAEDTMTILRSTGDITLSGCDAGEIIIETDTGDVTGMILTEKIFYAHTETGRVEVPNTKTGGRCEITTDTGDIRITVNMHGVLS